MSEPDITQDEQDDVEGHVQKRIQMQDESSADDLPGAQEEDDVEGHVQKRIQ